MLELIQGVHDGLLRWHLGAPSPLLGEVFGPESTSRLIHVPFDFTMDGADGCALA